MPPNFKMAVIGLAVVGVSACGGGGGGINSGGGAGGTGGGGAAGASNANGTAGTVNTGSGGGGGNQAGAGGGYASTAGAAGGSGIVIIAYADTYPAATLTNLTYTQPTRSGYRVYSITASSSGTITF